ncbi:MAG: methylmalonyl-CoA epimerase [Syntrophales bacterium]|jgi:methylmalonyl-CoA/ethylmalonyl-CoA epimerase|nr:methylmalonyl-CoA epimerase [Syntrophales bacterium]
MKVISIDHIGIAVKSIEESLKIYKSLGLAIHGTEEVEEQKVRTAFLPIGETEIELLESTSPDGPIAKYIESKKEGVQHIALGVENIEEAIAELKAVGIRMIDEKPRYGAGGARIAFIHPSAAHGVLLELCERNRHETGSNSKRNVNDD